MSIYVYKRASEYVKNFVICLDLLFYFVSNLQLILYVRVFWRITFFSKFKNNFLISGCLLLFLCPYDIFLLTTGLSGFLRRYKNQLNNFSRSQMALKSIILKNVLLKSFLLIVTCLIKDRSRIFSGEVQVFFSDTILTCI